MPPFHCQLTTRFVLGMLLSAAATKVHGETGLRGTSAEPVVRREASGAPADKTWLYQCALPFQVSSTQAAIFCNLREALAQGVDFEVGNDVIVFGSLAEIGSAAPVVANRNHDEPNPNTMPPGKPATMVKYPIRGGFVPLGAKRSDGSPHPHAGTGFGISMAQAWKTLVDGPPPYLQNSYSGAEAYGYLELQQYAFDGRTFRVEKTERVPFTSLLEGWRITNGGMTNAVADGDDLLVPMVGTERRGNSDGKRFGGAGLLRMQRQDGAWRAVSFDPITPLNQTIEPSVIRDVDGRLLASARGGGERRHDVRIARSDDGGRTWSIVVEVVGLIGPGPVTLNQAADGTPFIAANLQRVVPGPNDPLRELAARRKIEVEPGIGSRNTLTLWPLTMERDKLSSPLEVLDCRAAFGPPVEANWTWRADHPSGMTVRLTDGNWHHVLGFRVQDYREIKEAMPPTPRTGMYLHEVLSTGPVLPTWNF
jgi:hypothetical protein